MKKSASASFFNFSQATMAASSSNVFRAGLGGVKGRVQAPRVPYVSEMVKIGGADCCFNTYDPDTKYSDRPPKALVVFLHGANTHGTFPTSRLVADLLVANGYACVAPDAPGHGLSSGMRGYLESGEKLIDFGVGAVDHAYNVYLEKIASEKATNPDMPTPGLKLFLIGSSMGGNIALQTSLRRREIVSGVILMAPMLRITLITPFTRFFIMKSAEMLPLAEAIPLRKNNNYRCPKITEECEKDMLKPHQEGDKIRLGSVKSLVELTDSLEAQFEKISTPCLVMVGDEDKQVNNEGAVDLVKKAQSKDMTLKRYPALHGLMGEPSPLVNRMQDDMLRWLDERCNREYYIQSSL